MWRTKVKQIMAEKIIAEDPDPKFRESERKAAFT